MTNDELYLPSSYRSRPANNSGFDPPGAAMQPVYGWIARKIGVNPTVRSVLDWGCGSGAMLMKYFGHLDTCGADVDYRLPELLARYPGRRWGVCPVPVDADLVISVDVIEHLDDPLDMLQQFVTGRWRHLFVTTPDRQLVAKYKCRDAESRHRQLNGPPRNPRHTREWTADEFQRLIARAVGGKLRVGVIGRFNVIAHCWRDNPTTG